MQLLCRPRQHYLLLLSENLSECSKGMLGSLWSGELLLAAARLYKEPQWQIQSDQLQTSSESQTQGRSITLGQFWGFSAACFWYFLERKLSLTTVINTMKERRNTQPLVVRCKLVLVGDVQCGKTAMLQVLAKDCYPEVCCNEAHVCE